jgi:cytidylate kinase
MGRRRAANTVSRSAPKCRFNYVDSGAMYRAVTGALEMGIDTNDSIAVIGMIHDQISFVMKDRAAPL